MTSRTRFLATTGLAALIACVSPSQAPAQHHGGGHMGATGGGHMGAMGGGHMGAMGGGHMGGMRMGGLPGGHAGGIGGVQHMGGIGGMRMGGLPGGHAGGIGGVQHMRGLPGGHAGGLAAGGFNGAMRGPTLGRAATSPGGPAGLGNGGAINFGHRGGLGGGNVGGVQHMRGLPGGHAGGLAAGGFNGSMRGPTLGRAGGSPGGLAGLGNAGGISFGHRGGAISGLGGSHAGLGGGHARMSNAGAINWGQRVGSMAGAGGRPGAGGPTLGGHSGLGNRPGSLTWGHTGGAVGGGVSHHGGVGGMRGAGGGLGGGGNRGVVNVNQTNFNSNGLANNVGRHGHGLGNSYGGYGRGGYGRRGWGYGGLGYGGLGYGGLGYGGLGYGGLGWGLGGLGLGFGSGLGWGLGLGLGYGLGYGGLGWGYGGLGYGGWGLGGLGYGGWGLGGLGYGGLGYGGWGLGGLGYGGWGLGGLGYGLGLSSWMYGPMLYNWGYSSYYNPYYALMSQPVVVYDYAQPLNPTAAAPEPTAESKAEGLFEKGRAAFKDGLYTAALDFDEQALMQLPHDPALHEFRALALFAMKRYSEAATALYAVLSVGPGWDWATLIGLYDKPETYTAQLRSLEAKVKADPESAPERFLLAYHYLTQGHGDAALEQLRTATQLQPKDKVSAELLEKLEKARRDALGGDDSAALERADPPAPRNVPGAAEPLAAAAVKEGNLKGTWTAEPSDDMTITLDLTEAGKFTWKVADHGKPRQFEGVRTSGNNLLTLAPTGDDPQPPIVGKLTWKDDDHFTFTLAGSGSNDPGLAFSRSK